MKAIADTGAFSSAMSQKHFDKIYNHLTQKPIKKGTTGNYGLHSVYASVSNLIHDKTNIQNWPFRTHRGLYGF